MRLRSWICAGATGLCVFFEVASPISSDASSVTTPIQPVSVQRVHSTAASHRLRRRGVLVAPTTCTSSSASSFIGVTSEGNFAGNASAVLGGSQNEACDSYDAVGTGLQNIIGNSGNAPESFIAGGNDNGITGNNAFIGSGEANSVGGDLGFVGAGGYNYASGEAAFVGSGDSEYLNQQEANGIGDPASGNVASGTDSFVGAGDLNQATGAGSFIGGGDYAWARTFATAAGNQVSGTDSFVGAGDQNNVSASTAFVGGGNVNTITSAGTSGVIAGGNGNKVSNQFATIAGGSGNLASGNASTIPGGYRNLAAGQFSFAAGFGSYASTDGSFVWSDYSTTAKHLQATKTNQFLARATGGVTFYSNAAMSMGVTLAPGSGAWASGSDRNQKNNVVALDSSRILAKVDSLPVSEWSYRSEPGVRHVGPMAQDFYAAFGIGEDDRHITSIDEDGIALLAIKAVHSENALLRADNRDLRARLKSDDTRLAAIEKTLRILISRR